MNHQDLSLSAAEPALITIYPKNKNQNPPGMVGGDEPQSDTQWISHLDMSAEARWISKPENHYVDTRWTIMECLQGGGVLQGGEECLILAQQA